MALPRLTLLVVFLPVTFSFFKNHPVPRKTIHLTNNMPNDDGSEGFMDFDGEDDTEPNAVFEKIQASQVFRTPPHKLASDDSRQKSSPRTRFVLMSDTHSEHRRIQLPDGDVLVHAGDWTKLGEPGTIADLCEYFKAAQERFENVIAIAGNHDITMHTEFYQKNHGRFLRGKRTPFDHEAIQASIKHCTYLQDSSCMIENGNLQVYGSPYSPEFCNWAFGLPRGDPILQKWQQIPSNTDILITHTPPLGRGDMTMYSGRAGCYDLLCEVQQRIRPRLHVFGHIHEDYGASYDGHTLYVNAACLDTKYQPTRGCIVVDVPHDPNVPAQVVRPQCPIKTPTDFVQWLRDNNLTELAKRAQATDLIDVEFENLLFDPLVFDDICGRLRLSRTMPENRQWQNAFQKIYCDSF